MKKKKEVITGFITRTRRSKKSVLTVSMLNPFLRFNVLFSEYIENNKYCTLDVQYTEKHVELKFYKNEKGTYSLKKHQNHNDVFFCCSALRKYLNKDIYEGKGIAHYSVRKTEERDVFVLDVITSDFE